MRSFFCSMIFLGCSAVVQNAAAAETTLDIVMRSPNPEKTLAELKANHPSTVTRLCAEIMATNFYQRAQEAGVSVIKSRRMISFCVDYTPEQATLKKAVQKPKPAAAPREVVQLRHVDFGRKEASVEAEHAALEKIQAQVMENAHRLGMKRDVEARLAQVRHDLAEAQKSYDNLTAVIIGMREDLKDIHGFKYFDPHAHDHDTPDHYIEALVQALEKGDKGVLTQVSREQVGQAQQLLKQANDNLAAAREDLARLNREMLSLSPVASTPASTSTSTSTSTTHTSPHATTRAAHVAAEESAQLARQNHERLTAIHDKVTAVFSYIKSNYPHVEFVSLGGEDVQARFISHCVQYCLDHGIDVASIGADTLTAAFHTFKR